MWRNLHKLTPLSVTVLYNNSQDGSVPPPQVDYTEPWVPRFVKTPVPVPGHLYFRSGQDPESPAVDVNGFPDPWQARFTHVPVHQLNRGLFQTNDAGAGDAGVEAETPPSYTPSKLPNGYRPRVSYLFESNTAQDPPPAPGEPIVQPWRAPIRQPIQKLVVRFDSGRGYPDVPPPPTPAEETPHTWSPRPLRQPYSPFVQRYALHNPAQDNYGEPVSQFMVLWAPSQAAQRAVATQKLRQHGDPGGVAAVVESQFPGFTPRPIQRTLPKPGVISSLFLTNEAQDFSDTPADSTFDGFVNRRTNRVLPLVVPGLLFVPATDIEAFTAGDYNPGFIGKYAPGRHTVSRGLFTNPDPEAFQAPEPETNPWQQHFKSPQFRYRPGKHNVHIARGVMLSPRDNTGTSFANAFILDVSTLSGLNLNYVETPLQEVGTSIQVEWVQAGLNQDLQLLGYAIRGKAGERAAQESSNSAGGLFILDTSRLDTQTSNVVHVPYSERGRSIQVEWVQSGDLQDLQILGYAIRGKATETMSQEQS